MLPKGADEKSQNIEIPRANFVIFHPTTAVYIFCSKVKEITRMCLHILYHQSGKNESSNSYPSS